MSTALERAEARRQHGACEAACAAAETHAAGLWDALAEVHRLEAFKVQGYSTFTEWAKVKLNVSDRQSYRYLAKAREVVAIAAQTGISIGEAADQVPLAPPPPIQPPTAPKTTPARVEVVDSWARPIKAAAKLTASISHMRSTPLTSEARIALVELLRSLQAVL